MRTRRANIVDIPALMDLARESSSAACWSREHYESFFPTSNALLSERLILLVEDAIAQQEDLPARVDQIIAFLVAHRVGKEWELENIVVAPKLQRRGVGFHLLSELIDHARAQNGSGIFLEVRESNRSARALYGKAGFQETGVRKGYYGQPPEDAIAYRLALS